MARHKTAAAEAIPTEELATQESATAPALAELTQPEQPARQWRTNPYPIKTVNLDGYKVQLQESRPNREDRADKEKLLRDDRWQMQIKFGEGTKQDEPSAAVREFIKSHVKPVTTREGKETQVQLFHWNERDRAWGMEIDFKAPATSRQKAEEVYKDVVNLVAQERGVGREL
jgi:hypothetical protein